jgi:hypothetical protein
MMYVWLDLTDSESRDIPINVFPIEPVSPNMNGF